MSSTMQCVLASLAFFFVFFTKRQPACLCVCVCVCTPTRTLSIMVLVFSLTTLTDESEHNFNEEDGWEFVTLADQVTVT